MVGEVPPSIEHSELELAIGDRVQVGWDVVDEELTLPIWRRA
jgi:hypothetical protein